jgi:ABC-type antimicrobial peptide transport system permease subunit
VKFNAVSPNYFEILDTRIVRGQSFVAGDGEAAVVVSEQFARQFFAGREALGMTIEVAGKPHRIVGIAQDAVVNEIGEAPQPYMYLPFDQGSYGETTFILDAAGQAPATASAARAALGRVATGLEPRRMVTLAQYIEYASTLHRTSAALTSILGLVGLVLTAVGVYGVVAYRTNRRMKEIGIRMALGAKGSQVRRLVMREGLVVALAGIAVGLPLAFAGTSFVGSMVAGLDEWDTVSFAVAALVLLLAIGVATFLPARRAMRIEPARALR